MKKIDWKKIKPHAIAILVFFALAVFFGLPEFQGKELRSHDDIQYKGSAKEIQDFRKENGYDPKWTGRMFSGMPDYLISFQTENNYLAKPVMKTSSLFLPRATSYLWLALLGFYILLLTFKVDPLVAVFGAIAFAFTTYYSIIIMAGHFAKNLAIAYFPFVLAGINLVLDKKYLGGGILIGLAMVAEISANHIQMTYYYFAFFVSLYLMYRLIVEIRKKEYKHIIISLGIIGFFLGGGTLSNMNKLLPTQEYTPYSTRGSSELTRLKESGEETGGLDRSYIVGYSYGTSEVMSFLIPNFKGGGNKRLSENTTAQNAVETRDKPMLEMFDQYWGPQDGSGGGIYLGTGVMLLFLFGLLIWKSRLKWFILASIVITVMLSWGKNYMGLTNLFIDYFPLYNKFRSVNSILIVAQFCIPLFAGLTLLQMAQDPESGKKKFMFWGKETSISIQKLFLGLSGVLALVLLFMWASPGSIQSFRQPDEFETMVTGYINQEAEKMGIPPEKFPAEQAAMLETQIGEVFKIAETARKAVFKADVLRTLLFLVICSVLIYLYLAKKIKGPVMIIGLSVITFIDLYTVDRRYLNEKTYKDKIAQTFEQTPADKDILTDKEIGYRVANLSVNTFNDATTSYFHRSIGGYHGAKMERYQELVEFKLGAEVSTMRQLVYQAKGKMVPFEIFDQFYALNMLNTKYIIPPDPREPVFVNEGALGAAWFVKEYKLVDTPDDELEGVQKNNPRNIAIINKKFEENLKGFMPAVDSTATITLDEYRANKLTYSYNSTVPQLTVFSEIYYEKGWNAYIDGKEVNPIRADYVLRALVVPAGKYTIEWKFEPAIAAKGETYSLIGNVMIIIGSVIGAVIYFIMRRKNKTTNA